MTDIAVIVVHWNVPELLRTCLRSLVEELDTVALSARVLVIDNASDARPMHEVMRAFPAVEARYLSENVGFAGACNIGIAETSGDAVFLLNPDTELLPGSLSMLWETMYVSPHIGLVAPLLLNPDGSLQSAGYRFPGLTNVMLDFFPIHPRIAGSRLNGRIHPGDGVSPVAIDYPLGAAMLVRRRALMDAGGLDENYFMYSEEIDLAQRLADNGWTRLLAPAARMIHYGGQSTGQQPARMYEALWRSRHRYFSRWLSPRKRWLVNRAVRLGTNWSDRKTEDRRAANARIRTLFANGESRRR